MHENVLRSLVIFFGIGIGIAIEPDIDTDPDPEIMINFQNSPACAWRAPDDA